MADEGSDPQFAPDSQRLYYLTGGGLEKKLMSVGVHGELPREVLSLKYPDFVTVSPDGKSVAFTELFNAYVAPLPRTGGSIELSKDSTSLPVTKVNADTGSYLHWSADSRSLIWMEGNHYFSRQVDGAKRAGLDVGLSLPTDQPTDLVAFSGARVVTMRDAEASEEVIEDGVVVVRGTDIVAVGQRGEVAIPAGARVIDASGKTLFPGIVDVHAHAANFSGGVVPQQNWAYYANLAFGITTMHDPSVNTETAFSQADLVIVNGNPLADIRATTDTAYVMTNGRLFDAATMAEIGGKQRQAPTFFWQRHGSAVSFGQENGPAVEQDRD